MRIKDFIDVLGESAENIYEWEGNVLVIKADDLRELGKTHCLLSKEDLELLLHFAPKDCSEGLDPTFYHTLTYEGDKEIQDIVDSMKAMLNAQEQEE